MARHRRTQPEILERGDIFFLYRPAVDQDEPKGLIDVQRFFVVLKPEGDEKFRLLVVGRKRLPDVKTHERFWGFVDHVERSATDLERQLRSLTYGTATRGERHEPAARPAGEGVYSITLLSGQMHLSYTLELPKHPGEVQKAFHIEPQASFALSVKNPEASTPPGVGLREQEKADYPDRLQAEFRDRRFEREDVRMLDYPGAEFILVGASAHPDETYGAELMAGEKGGFPDIFRELHLRRADHPVRPLMEGKWE
jgi:hypothetical protein